MCANFKFSLQKHNFVQLFMVCFLLNKNLAEERVLNTKTAVQNKSLFWSTHILLTKYNLTRIIQSYYEC